MEVAIQLSTLGARVLAVGRDLDRLSHTMNLLSPGDHQYLQTDLGILDGLDQMTLFLEDQEGLYGLVHAAGSQIVKPLKVTRPVDYMTMYEIHVMAAAEIMRRMANKMGRQGEGSFVLLSSVSALRGGSGIGAYAAAKAAVISLTKTAAIELAGQGIRVNCLVPGLVTTPMSGGLLSRLPAINKQAMIAEHALGVGKPTNVADAAAFLLSDNSTWITGASIPVDGGFLAR